VKEVFMKPITINGITIDPSAPQATLNALALNNKTAQDSDYLIVQVKQPLAKEQRAELEAVGVVILEAVPGDAFICYFPKTDLVPVRALSFVDWVELYPKAVKVSPSLRNVEPRSEGVAARPILNDIGSLDASPKNICIVLQRNANPQTAAQRIADAAHTASENVQISRGRAYLTVKARRLGDIAALDEIRSIEETFSPELHNSVARQILRIPVANPIPGNEGAGEIVAIADTGFDLGSTTNVHPAFQGRIRQLYALGRNNTGQSDDPYGHGTHVAGSVLGDGLSATEGIVRGTAPKAELVMQSLYVDDDYPLGGLPKNLNDLFEPPYVQDEVRIHTNSWGFDGNFSKYTQEASDVDQFIHTHRDMLICFSVGNAGIDRNADGQVDPVSVTPPATAKNCLTIGACENNRPNMHGTYATYSTWNTNFPVNPILTDKVANNPEGLVAFSSRGPTHDGRIKPDVIAPGTYILSTRSRVTKSEGWGISSDPLYMFDGGTSMATPLVAGCVANIRAFLRQSHGLNSPSAALLKALVINGAHELLGQYIPSEAGKIPNSNQGFGRVDLQAVVGPYEDGETLVFFDEDALLDTGETTQYVIKIPEGASLLKVTLVWTDPPGEGLQSDLDLTVRVGEVARHGNMPAGSIDFDRTNNVEQVMWSNVPSGTATVTVTVYRVTLEPQNFALVIRVV
jgi:serine protease AprX